MEMTPITGGRRRAATSHFPSVPIREIRVSVFARLRLFSSSHQWGGALPSMFQGCDNRKNKLPVDGEFVALLLMTWPA